MQIDICALHLDPRQSDFVAKSPTAIVTAYNDDDVSLSVSLDILEKIIVEYVTRSTRLYDIKSISVFNDVVIEDVTLNDAYCNSDNLVWKLITSFHHFIYLKDCFKIPSQIIQSGRLTLKAPIHKSFTL